MFLPENNSHRNVSAPPFALQILSLSPNLLKLLLHTHSALVLPRFSHFNTQLAHYSQDASRKVAPLTPLPLSARRHAHVARIESLLDCSQIKYLLFDCDNTLCLSEELAFAACAELSNEILEAKGLPDRYTGPVLMKEFVGQNFRSMSKNLAQKHNFDLPDEELNGYVSKELGKVIASIERDCQPCVGVLDELEKLANEKKYGMAVVSSSAIDRVYASIRKCGMSKYFPDDKVYSAADSLPTPTTKPDPAIYLFACQQLGVEPGSCIAIEDSRSGATAAKRAGIPLVGYIGPYEEDEKDEKRKMLEEECGALYVMNHWSELPEAIKKIEGMAKI
jgi:HAD superfamily hydrolase (TIGR01509 family)